MSDHQVPMDRLLREAFRTPPGELTKGFEEKLARRIGAAERRPLTGKGRMVLAAYAAVAGVITVWGLARIEWRWEMTWAAMPLSYWAAAAVSKAYFAFRR